jgi:hypothetical protein
MWTLKKIGCWIDNLLISLESMQISMKITIFAAVANHDVIWLDISMSKLIVSQMFVSSKYV